MGIIKNTINKQISSNNSQKYFNAIATVVSYSSINNMATIRFNNPNGEGTLLRKNVPIADTLGGICGYNLCNGDKCSIEFRNGNIFMPVITGVIKSFYEGRKNTRQGACIVDEYINETSEPEEISPMYNDWIDENNDIRWKYVDESTEGIMNTDNEKMFYDIIHNANNYSGSEQGITNLINNSTVKIKENGDIEMFVENNIGIRISKQMQKIYIYGLAVEVVQ